MNIRGIRGATTVSEDTPQFILQATRELLQEILKVNPSLCSDEIASVFFTVTADLCSAFPAQAARELGWTQVPLMCAQEIPVPGALPHCIRVLIHWNTSLQNADIHHVYLGEAKHLRPDLDKANSFSISREVLS